MSLLTDKVFFEALKSNTELMTIIGNRLYSTSITLPDENLDNVPVPYVIVSFDALNNEGLTKDGYEGDSDAVTIGVEITATTRPDLGDIANTIRTTIREYFEDIEATDEMVDLVPLDYQFSAGPVQYDSTKPCFWQVLSYQCDTKL